MPKTHRSAVTANRPVSTTKIVPEGSIVFNPDDLDELLGGKIEKSLAAAMNESGAKRKADAQRQPSRGRPSV